MIAHSTQLIVLGIVAVLGGTFVLVKRKSLAKANAKTMIGRGKWTRLDYSEDYFLFLGTLCGIFFIMVGCMSLVSGIFRSDDKLSSDFVGYVIYGFFAVIALGFVISLPYVYFRFGNKK